LNSSRIRQKKRWLRLRPWSPEFRTGDHPSVQLPSFRGILQVHYIESLVARHLSYSLDRNSGQEDSASFNKLQNAQQNLQGGFPGQCLPVDLVAAVGFLPLEGVHSLEEDAVERCLQQEEIEEEIAQWRGCGVVSGLCNTALSRLGLNCRCLSFGRITRRKEVAPGVSWCIEPFAPGKVSYGRPARQQRIPHRGAGVTTNSQL
jgi:hypothetical protein